MIYLIGITINAFLTILLLTKKNKNTADKILFIWLCITTIHLVIFALISSQEHLRIPYLLGTEIVLPLLHGPFLYLYVTAFSAQPAKTLKSLLHFIPFVLAVLYILPFLLLDVHNKVMVYENEGKPFQTQSIIIFAASLVSGIVYCLLSLQFLHKHRNIIKDNFSYTEKIDLKWLFYLAIGLLSIYFIALCAEDEYTFGAIVIYVLFIGYFGIKQVGIFTNQQIPATPNTLDYLPPLSENSLKNDVPSKHTKYVKSTLSAAQIKKIHTELSQLMHQEKPYKLQGLTLAELAKKLDVHPNSLSQVINDMEQKSFFDYINALRIEEFKLRVGEAENLKYTLLFLAYECGFNSKTSFNRNFKNSVGKSPSEYLKECHINLPD